VRLIRAGRRAFEDYVAYLREIVDATATAVRRPAPKNVLVPVDPASYRSSLNGDGTEAMASKAQAAKPMMTDAAIKARTGKSWDQWFAALDQAGANKLDHKAIATILNGKMGAGPWFGQMIAVSYERARGLRAVNQKCDGEFAVSVSKTLPVDVSTLYEALADDRQRAQWFPKGVLEITSQTKDKYFRGAWGRKGARLEVGFYAKSAGKAQIALQVNRLDGPETVESERAVWKKAMERLARHLAEIGH
jgi:hypothetical protein